MLHTFAFSGVKTDSTANEAAPAVADASMTRTANANQYLMPADLLVIGAVAWNDTITRARLNFPSYRDVGLPEIFPLNRTALSTVDYDVCIWGVNGPRVRKTEELGVDTSNGASTVDNVTVGLFVADRIDGIPAGRRFTVRGTALQTLVLNAWSIGTLTLDQTLPFGRYGVIGMQAACANGLLARLVFPNSSQWRPGCPVGDTILVNDFRQNFRQGQFGLLGTFDQTSPPQVEILGGAAGAQTPAVILDLVELGR